MVMYLEKFEIVYWDIKFENIYVFFNFDDFVLIDFGVVCELEWFFEDGDDLIDYGVKRLFILMV